MVIMEIRREEEGDNEDISIMSSMGSMQIAAGSNNGFGHSIEFMSQANNYLHSNSYSEIDIHLHDDDDDHHHTSHQQTPLPIFLKVITLIFKSIFLFFLGGIIQWFHLVSLHVI